MNTKAYKVIKGEKGYVPVYDNSRGGVKIGQIDNGKVVYRLMDAAVEYSYTQIDERVVSEYGVSKSVNTGQYWIELPHLEEVVSKTKKYKLINYDFGTCVIEVEEL